MQVGLPHAKHFALPATGTATVVSVDGWADLFHALSDSNRLRILLAVHDAPGINVTELAATVGMTANAASHALTVLRMHHMIAVERCGRERRWSIASDQIHNLLYLLGTTAPPR